VTLISAAARGFVVANIYRNNVSADLTTRQEIL